MSYVSEVGQHPCGFDDALLSYATARPQSLRKPLCSRRDDSSRRRQSGYPLVENAIGIHGSISPNGKYFATDVFDWPEPGARRIALRGREYNYRVLVRTKVNLGTPKTICTPTLPGPETETASIDGVIDELAASATLI